jgi:hypothetical protein
MNTTTKRRRSLRPGLWVALAFTLTLAAVALAQSGVRLMFHGKTVSNDIHMINGKAYVPLTDMAKAMGGKVVKIDDGYSIQTDGGDSVPAGGANEVNGLKGTLGQMLFTGKWRFEAVSVSRAPTYDSQYLPDHRTFEPSGENQELVMVKCRLKNAMTTTETAMLSPIHPHNIALADDQGQSYAPLGFDKNVDSTDEGPHMLPGSQTDFVVIFSVTKGTHLKDLVFSLQRAYDDTPDGGVDVRISLGS